MKKILILIPSLLCFVFLLSADTKDRVLELGKGNRFASPNARLENGEVVCDNGEDAHLQTGWRWSVPLDQTEPRPFAVTAESLAEATSGGDRPLDYSLYLDITYADRTYLWGQAAAFSPDAELGWQCRRVTVVPDKPVKSFNCHLLFRNTAGRVRFRAPRLTTRDDDTLAMYDTWMQDLSALPDPDGLPRFLIRNAAGEEGFRLIRAGTGAAIRLADAKTHGPHGETFFDVMLTATSDGDHAITLVYALPIPGTDAFTWFAKPDAAELLTPTSGPRRVTANQQVGEGPLSRWPFGAVAADGHGLALGFDPAAPAVFRVSACPATRELLIAFDLALTPEKPSARLRFVRYPFDASLGFRGALAAYQGLFPETTEVRLKRHGLWMAFHRISSVQGWEDFGFAVKEGDNEPGWDDAHGLVTFHYTEPSTWWMPMKKSARAYTLADCRAEAERRADRGEAIARAWRIAACKDRYGKPVGTLKDTPWCVGAVWNLSSLPDLQGGEYDCKLRDASWEKRYRSPAPEGVDGEYIDSAEGYVTAPIDFDRAHFAAANTPLVYDPETRRPGVAKCLSFYEYVKTTSERCHAKGRYLMGNGIPCSWPWLVPYSDFGGQETSWIDRNGTWRPMSVDELRYRRAMSGGKPYCFLMNVDFDRFPYELVEKYMQRTLAFGLFASFFSPDASGGHYFSRPELYNRDRPLFKKYVPLCRLVSEAGWRAVNTLAKSETEDLVMEQFGERYLTLFNPTDRPLRARLRLHTPVREGRELVTGTDWSSDGDVVEFEIPAECVRLLSTH